MRIWFVFLVVLSLAGGSDVSASPAQETTIPGTRVSLIPPDDFILTSRFPGFWHETVGASIMVTEFPASLVESVAGFGDRSALGKRGLTLVHKQEVNVNNQKGLLLRIKQVVSGIDYLKWLLIFGNEKESVMVAASFPEELETELSERMKASILTAKWNKEIEVSLTEGLNFTVTAKGEMIPAKRIANALLYTWNGIFPSKVVDHPFFIVGQTLSKIDISDKKEFAKKRLLQTATITDIALEYSRPVTVDKLSGYELIAKGTDKESGQSMVIYQMILYEDEGYYLMQGIVSSRGRRIHFPIFREIARSFKRKN